MKAIICGAGQVGSNIARELAGEDIDVTVVDRRPNLIHKIGDTLDVRAMVGHASYPDTLEAAGARDCDMLVAVTYSDEVNMVACQVAHSLFDTPMKIARLRAPAYLQPIWSDLFSRDNLPIDVIISPEIEVAEAIGRRLTVPGAFDLIPLADNLLRLVGIRCAGDCPIINTPLRELTSLFPDLHMIVVGIVRGGKATVPSDEDQIFAGDEVYAVVLTEQLSRAMAAFGYDEPEARRIIVIGGGNVGLTLTEKLESGAAGHKSSNVIELDRARAELVAQRCPRSAVIHGDALDPDILDQAGAPQAETVVAVTNDDEANILASLLAKQRGTRRAVALVNNASYTTLVGSLGIDVVVNPREITVSRILQHIRRGRIRSVHSIREGFGEIIEAEALETSPLVGVALKEAHLPAGVLIAAIIRGGTVMMPGGATVMQPGDHVVLFAAKQAVKRVEKLFSVRLEFF